METAPDGVDVVGGDPEYSHRSLPFTRDLQAEITQSLILFKDFGPIQSYQELKQQMMDSPHLRTPFGMRRLSQVERAIVFLTSRPVLSAGDPCLIGLRIYVRRKEG